MSAGQIVAVLLVVAAFVAGWVLRGLQLRREGDGDQPGRGPRLPAAEQSGLVATNDERAGRPAPFAVDLPAPREPAPTAEPEAAPASEPEPAGAAADSSDQAVTALERARKAYRAARDTAGDTAGADRRLDDLDAAISEAETWADRLAAGEGPPGFAAAYDRAVNALVGLQHVLERADPDADAALRSREGELDAAWADVVRSAPA